MSDKIRETLEALGLTGATMGLVHLLPLVYVAWSDGEIQSEELDVIAESAHELGIGDDASLELLQSWLAERPPESFFREGLKLLSFSLASLEQDEAEAAAADVTALCAAVAKAAGGLGGHEQRIDPSEQMALRKVTMRLKLGSRPETRKALQSILRVATDDAAETPEADA